MRELVSHQLALRSIDLRWGGFRNLGVFHLKITAGKNFIPVHSRCHTCFTVALLLDCWPHSQVPPTFTTWEWAYPIIRCTLIKITHKDKESVVQFSSVIPSKILICVSALKWFVVITCKLHVPTVHSFFSSGALPDHLWDWPHIVGILWHLRVICIIL